EDGIRDPLVTGVQTCALPISLLAQHRRNHGADGMTSLTALVVALDPEPAHLAAPAHELFTHGREVVLGVAGRDAGGAAGAFGQVDRHRPGRMLASVLPGRAPR